MTIPQALVAVAALLAVAMIAVVAAPRAEAQRTGPFQLMHHSNTTANAGVFRLDTVSGEVSYCYLTGETFTSESKLICTKASAP